jgi:hypothetical protein
MRLLMNRWLTLLVPVPLVVTLVLGGGCPTVDLGDAPVAPGACRPAQDYYRDVIWPQYLAPADPERSCVSAPGCHRDTDGRSALRLAVVEPLSDRDHSTNYEIVTNFLSCGTPETSALLTKPLEGENPHGGGDLFAPDSEAFWIFLDWFDS